MSPEKISLTERLILTNQFRILELLDRKEANEYRRRKEILQNGFTHEYGDVFQWPMVSSEELSESECQDVLDVMKMYSRIEFSFKKLNADEQLELDERRKLPGFEGKKLSYANWYIEQGRFLELKYGVDAADLDSHGGVNDYDEMLKKLATYPEGDLAFGALKDILGMK